MRREIERLRPYLERARSFSGWDFSELEVRHIGPPAPWDYEELAREHAVGSRSVLDMGTGGGEVLSRVREALPPFVVATERWHVNLPVAHKRLTPLGVRVVRARNKQLPFRDGAVDLVLNRHEGLEPAEVARVLRAGGRIVTQQVGWNNWRELRRHIPRMTDFGDQFADYARGFAEVGLEVTVAQQHDQRAAYRSLGDFVFMLGVTPWTIPEFTLERDGEALLALEAECLTDDGLVLTESRFVIVAEKSSAA